MLESQSLIKPRIRPLSSCFERWTHQLAIKDLRFTIWGRRWEVSGGFLVSRARARPIRWSWEIELLLSFGDIIMAMAELIVQTIYDMNVNADQKRGTAITSCTTRFQECLSTLSSDQVFFFWGLALDRQCSCHVTQWHWKNFSRFLLRKSSDISSVRYKPKILEMCLNSESLAYSSRDQCALQSSYENFKHAKRSWRADSRPRPPTLCKRLRKLEIVLLSLFWVFKSFHEWHRRYV